ncbi:hypothetical protein V495_04140 [Pseudogymnoascus sp. VKM F-4514 (FW-929)]|nr:hypothetical protein V495_04140 [Pseudogymnoascus sp. VKM F-4514 (FW-929)]
MSGVDGPATSRYSSSPELSSPPCSPSDPGSPAARQLLRDQRDAQDSDVVGNAGVVDERAALPAAPPARKKPGRKPKVPVAADGASATSTDAKPKRTRKAREPKDPNTAPVPRKKRATATQSTTTTTAAEQDADDNNNNNNNPTAAKPTQAATRQSKLTDMNMRPVTEPGYSILNEPFQPQPPHQQPYNGAAVAPQNGKFEDIQKATPVSFFNAAPPQQAQPPPQPQPVRSSGQNYDPIRSNYDPRIALDRESSRPSAPVLDLAVYGGAVVFSASDEDADFCPAVADV